MRSRTLLIFLLLPAMSFAQMQLKYVHLNWNIVGHFDAPNFSQYIQAYNLNGPKPPGETNYGFRIRGADALSLMTAFGTKKGRASFILSYTRGSTLIDRFGAAPTPEWKKSLNYDYQNIGVGLMLHLLKSKNENSRGLPRIHYQLGLGREFNRLQYTDQSGANNKYRTGNFGATTFIQYNFYAPYLGGPPIRVVWGVNLGYHASLRRVDFSPLQSDLSFQSSNRLTDRLQDLTLGVTLGFLSDAGGKKVKQSPLGKPKFQGKSGIYALGIGPIRMLELSAVDSATGQSVNALYEVFDEQKKQPIALLRDKYIANSIFKDLLTVYVTARAKGYFVKEVAVEGYDTLKTTQEILLRKIPQSPVGVFHFEQSSSKMTEDDTSKIDSVVSVLQRNQHMNITIVGHTSADGSSRLNRTLSLKRAKVIKKLLLKSGVEETRITVTGVGSAQPKVVRGNDELQSMNRRVEVFLK